MSKKPTLADINKRNKEFWAEIKEKIDPLLEDATLVGEVVNAQTETALRWGGVRGLNSLESDLIKSHETRKEKLALEEKAAFGTPFKDNANKDRKPGPVRLAIRKALKKNAALKNAALWELLAAKPPKGWQFYDNHLGKYAEGPEGGQNMNYATFRNAAAFERKILKH